MRHPANRRGAHLLSAACLAVCISVGCSTAGDPSPPDDVRTHSDADGTEDDADAPETPETIRVATFNTSLSRDAEGRLVDDLKGGDDTQARKIARILQHVRPDVVLLNEFDRDEDGDAARLFAQQYLAVGWGDEDPLDYSHRYVPETNTGVHSGADLNKDGRTVSTPGEDGYGDDAYGFGAFPGQYGMVVYSRYPLMDDEVRTFREFQWREMPNNLLPENWYTDEAVDVLRLSSKNHLDLPVDVGGERLHLLASHPTPPGFDGEEDRNGRRNHDEIRFWTDYLSGGQSAAYIRDDAGRSGGLPQDQPFVLVGDLNSDPEDGDGRHGAIRGLLEHDRLRDPRPSSDGAEQTSEADGRINETHDGDPSLDTADFEDRNVGNLRVDYALPSDDLAVEDAGVFWPAPDADDAELTSASDHRAVGVDVRLASP